MEFYKIKAARRLTTLQEVIAALQSSGPVVAGVSMYEAGLADNVKKTGMIPMPLKGDHTLGATAMCIVGYDDDRKLLKFVSSWSPGWGDHGYGHLSFAYFEQNSDEAWAISM